MSKLTTEQKQAILEGPPFKVAMAFELAELGLINFPNAVSNLTRIGKVVRNLLEENNKGKTTL